MKNSGVEWIGEIPADWKLDKVKYKTSSHPNKNDGSIIKSVSLENIESLTSKFVETENEYDFSQAYVAEKGDILFGKLRPYLAKVFRCEETLCVGPGIAIFTPTKCDSKFLKYSFLNTTYIDYVNSFCHGTKMPAIDGDVIRNSLMPFPPYSKQVEIGKRLDYETEKIQSLMENLNNQIEKLEEYKKSLIFECVTKGLNPNVNFKGSGALWIGEIPENWTTIRIKYTSWLKGRIGWQGLKSSEYRDQGPYLITGTDFKDGYIDWETCVHISRERFDEAPEIHIKEDDMLITKDGTIGKVAIAKDCPSEVSLNSGVLLIRNVGKYKYFDRFLYYVLLSDEFLSWYGYNQPGNSTIRHLYQEQFYEFAFAYPPLDEQMAISKYLDKKCSVIDSLIEAKQKRREKLKEYQKTLIYEYVTGKKEDIN